MLGEVIKPNIISSEQSGSKLLLELHIPENLAYFAGHFPGIAVVPGVVQLQWAIQFSHEAFGIPEIITQGNKIKFSNLMLSNHKVLLHLSHEPEERMIIYTYSNINGKYSSGNFIYQILQDNRYT